MQIPLRGNMRCSWKKWLNLFLTDYVTGSSVVSVQCLLWCKDWVSQGVASIHVSSPAAGSKKNPHIYWLKTMEKAHSSEKLAVFLDHARTLRSHCNHSAQTITVLALITIKSLKYILLIKSASLWTSVLNCHDMRMTYRLAVRPRVGPLPFINK